MRLLERELGSLFRPIKERVPPPPAEFDPISIQFVKSPAAIAADDQLVTQTSFNVLLKEDSDEEEVGATLVVRVPILENENSIEGDPLPLVIDSDQHEKPIYSESELDLPITLKRAQPARFSLQTIPYDPGWSARVVVQVRRQMEH
jgi:hypothetical protein